LTRRGKAAALFVASVAYVGYAPVAPGTAGSVVGVIAARGLGEVAPAWLEVGVTLVLFLVGVAVAGQVEHLLARKDPPMVVLDEVVGMMVGLLGVAWSWPAALGGFLLFRVFDIWKPYPCRQAERLAGGWGIMADDLVAGIYTNLVLRLVMGWLPPGLLG
jgi:phosphatidylglycerophosphatase A